MNSSYIEIIGNLERDIEIQETTRGIKHGVIWVGEKRSFVSSFEDGNFVNKTFLFNVYIWNQELLNEYAHLLKQGTKVLVMGEINILEEGEGVKTINYNTIRFTNFIIDVKSQTDLIILEGKT